MKSTRSQGTFVALLTLAFVLGIGTASAVYWLLVAPDRTDDMATITEPSSPEEQVERETPERIDFKETSSLSQTARKTVRNLDELLAIKSAFERSVALRNLLLESNEAQVVELFSQSKDLARNDYRNSIQTVLIQRLAHLNPKRALSRALSMDSQEYSIWQFISNVFQEWAHSDLDEAVAHARSLDENWKETALRAIVQERMDLSEEILLAIARDLGNEQVAVGAITVRKIEDALEDPERAWNELALDLQNDSQHIWTIARVATTWVEQDGTGVLDQINQSLTNGDTRRWVLRSVLNDVAVSDPAGAFRFALTVDNDQYSVIASGVIDTWAQTDPQSALAAASEVEKRTLRRQLEESVVRTWGYSKPREVLDSIDVLPEHLQSTAISTALRNMAGNYPEEAAALVVGMNSGDVRTAAANAVVYAWVDVDYEAALAWIQNEPTNKEIQSQLLQGILYKIVGIDPQLAMDIALAQPIEEDQKGMFRGMSMEVTVISSLVYSDLDKAIELLPQVRKGAARLQAYQMVSGAMIRDGDIDDALNLAQQLSESDRESFYMSLASTWAGSDPEGLLNSIDRLPSKAVKSRAAMMLLSFNRHQENLTQEQVDHATKLLTDEDAKALEEGGENVYYGW